MPHIVLIKTEIDAVGHGKVDAVGETARHDFGARGERVVGDVNVVDVGFLVEVEGDRQLVESISAALLCPSAVMLRKLA